MKYFKAVIIGLGLIPFCFIIPLLTFYFHAGMLLGGLPSYSHPDPKDLPIFSPYSIIIDPSWRIWLISLIAWAIVTPFFIFKTWKNINWRPILFSAIGQTIAFLLFLSGIMLWYLD